MKYAILRISGHQYKVSPGDEILVDKIDEVTPEVLMVVDGEKVKIGTPLVEGVKLKIEKLEDVKGEKIRVFKYKAKSRYRKTRGFRSQMTKLRVSEISF